MALNPPTLLAFGRRYRPYSFEYSVSCLRESRFQKLANRVANGDVHFLNARRRSGRNAQTNVACRLHLAPRLTRQTDDVNLALASRFNRAQNIPAVAAGGDRQQHVVRPGMGSELAGKHMFVSVVVPDCRKRRGVAV